ncbi:hypothetical protein E2A64_14000 [Pseudohoeflea suaedae]|uniref:Uncharacterized protein n=1 Tax=Pseudohoeflea suaedae TaxID=877384 RepID=A0A4R5PI90_9HYPH|nr:hypothetical protein [Pseudohoeflea suaedae]TDH34851.1 hypothetical protein E2A64_14000 [Pseudohoeflea suaedae]
MSYLVTLDMYSGRENPHWVLTGAQASELLKRSQNYQDRFGVAPAPRMLGYRGVEITPIATQDGVAAPLVDSREAELNNGSVYVSGIPELEDFIVSTGKAFIEPDTLNYIQNAFKTPASRLSAATTGTGCPKCVAADAPAYDPDFWNTPQRQPKNNCYNYANNQATDTFAQPGRATGMPITGLSCKGVQPSAQSDGLKPSADFSTPLKAGAGWYVALVIWPGKDYHWYRQDNVGCWSHKAGETAARNTDDSNNPITDPKTCDRGPYTDFCTYMITGSWVTIS